jgi:hypothetical protein
LWRMTVYAIASILSGTTFPLRFVLYLAAAVGMGFPVYVKLMRLTPTGTAVAAAVVSLYFLLVTLPLLGLYLARTYKNVVGRPIFVIDDTRTCL